MGRLFWILFCVPGILASCKKTEMSVSSNVNMTSYVDPFVGTDGPGNTYPGAVVPFGMVQLSPDNGLPGWDRIAGYFWQDSTIAGFSHKHLTGTGAGDLYDVLILPFNSRFKDDLWKNQEEYRPYSKFTHERESASPGYYMVELLSSGIKAELTATKRVGMHKYTFPKDSASKILIDLGYCLNWDAPTETYLKVKNDTTITGYRYSKGWAPDQREHFVIHVSRPIKCVVLYNGENQVDGSEVKATKTKAVLSFHTEDNDKIMVKVAFSSYSITGAENNLQEECNGWNFDQIVERAREMWERRLETIIVEGTEEQKKVFYTNLYHCFLTPSLHSDIDGWYKGADGEYHQAKGYNRYDTYSLWDTYRAAHPLYTIIAPGEVEDMLASFFGHYYETGLLPVWSFVGNETNMMIAYHSVPVIVDAFFKGIAMDTFQLYDACVATAKSDAWDLSDYKKYGYVPFDDKEDGHWCVSKTLEYAYDDWCIAQFAKVLNKDGDYQYFIKRADNWRNLFDKETGFFRPKDKKGKFIEHFVPKEYTEYFCESNAWHYFWHVQHDIQGLVEITGKDAFKSKLDSMFSYRPTADDKLPIFSTGMIGQYAHGNEPSHHVAYLYNELGEPNKTQELVRKIITSQYSSAPDGYCGNEDCGQMSAWLVMSSMGLYPINPANGIYSLTSPWISKATINMPNGNQFIISTENQAEANVYIKGIILNGLPYQQTNITHETMMQGGELHFILSNSFTGKK